jgi:hypothetical protein
LSNVNKRLIFRHLSATLIIADTQKTNRKIDGYRKDVTKLTGVFIVFLLLLNNKIMLSET